MRYVKFLLILLIMVIGAAFALMNPGEVEIHYYFGTRTLPLSLVIVASVGMGAIIGILAGLGRSFKLRRENSSLRRKVRLASQEVNNLRAIPIKDS